MKITGTSPLKFNKNPSFKKPLSQRNTYIFHILKKTTKRESQAKNMKKSRELKMKF